MQPSLQIRVACRLEKAIRAMHTTVPDVRDENRIYVTRPCTGGILCRLGKFSATLSFQDTTKGLRSRMPKKIASGSAASFVEYPLFREYEKSRQTVNNATMALLAGSRLALHTLQLTKGSERLLPEIFPGVDHINKFNLKTETANELLLDAANHLGAVTIPYVLAIHTQFVNDTLKMLGHLGFSTRASGDNPDLEKNKVNASNMHEAVHLSLGGKPFTSASRPAEYELFDLLRAIRNSLIHSGGKITSDLKSVTRSMSAAAKAEWLRLEKRDAASILKDDPIRITTNEIFTTFAVTKKVCAGPLEMIHL